MTNLTPLPRFQPVASSSFTAILQPNGRKSAVIRGRSWNLGSRETPRQWRSEDVSGRWWNIVKSDLHAGGRRFKSRRLHQPNNHAGSRCLTLFRENSSQQVPTRVDRSRRLSRPSCTRRTRPRSWMRGSKGLPLKRSPGGRGSHVLGLGESRGTEYNLLVGPCGCWIAPL